MEVLVDAEVEMVDEAYLETEKVGEADDVDVVVREEVEDQAGEVENEVEDEVGVKDEAGNEVEKGVEDEAGNEVL